MQTTQPQPKILQPEAPVVILEPPKSWRLVPLRELWEYRDLLYFLVWRDVKVRYKQAAFGVGWALLQPLMSMVVFTIFFGRLAKIPSDGVPYPVFAYSALVPWQLFANALTQSSNSLVTNQSLIKKVYFPRVLVPVGAVLEQVVDFSIAFALLVAMVLYYRLPLTPRMLAVPLFMMMAVLTSFSVGLWLSALNAQFRDVRYVVPFLVQLWMFASPVVYPATLVPPQWRALYGLNPMAGVIEGFRWSMLGGSSVPGPELAVSAAGVLVVLLGGLIFFRRVERSLADLL